MELDELRRHWDDFGRQDPLWAILTRDDMRGRRWNEDAFFAAGRREVASLIQHLEELGYPVARRRALDFGCGVGRITQALCRYFEECEGLDIAPSMIALSQRYNRHGSRCRYYVNATTDLHRFENDRFDLVYSNLVLQHMRPEFAQRYVEEFIRVVAPEGIVAFQVPAERAEREAARALSAPGSEALPDTAFAARVVVNASSLNTRPAIGVPLTIRVRNTGTATWPARGAAGGEFQVNLGNHWLDESGRIVTFDDARAQLPHDLRPLEGAIMELVVTAPPQPGRYLLELDMVQEGVAWFGSKGADTARIPVTVRHAEPGSRTSAAEPQGQPRMEMHGVRPDTVVDWVTSAGARLIDLQIVEAAGTWPGFVYYVTKEEGQHALVVDFQRVLTSVLAQILPPVAFHASIGVVDPAHGADRGTTFSLSVTVKNLSPITWPGAGRLGRHQIKVGNHWLDDNGQLLVTDDGRSTLLHDLGPGEETMVVLVVRVPAKSGPHILELDLVQEYVAWFSAFGSGTTRVPVLVR